MKITLPEPSQEAQQHSEKLCRFLHQKIQQQGSITFADYMQNCLYEPGLGYYSAGAQKFGASGDFITAPEISPLFGQVLAQQLLPLQQQLTNFNILELGPGSGKLCAHILLKLAELDALPHHYYLLEVSADLRERQQKFLAQVLPQEIFVRCIWLSQLPENFSGAIIANEVLDALPVHQFMIDKDGPKEIYVSSDGQNFSWRFAAPSSNLLSAKLQQLQENYHLDQTYQSEVNLQQEALLASLCNCLQQGLLLIIDYGFPAKEYYHPDRQQGTLVCHYRHHVLNDPFYLPGLQDITAHVDFTAAALSIIQHQAELITFTNQAGFLMAGNLEKLLIQHESPTAQIQQSIAVQKLTSPAEMGELFKVLLAGKNIDTSVWQEMFTAVDQKQRL